MPPTAVAEKPAATPTPVTTPAAEEQKPDLKLVETPADPAPEADTSTETPDTEDNDETPAAELDPETQALLDAAKAAGRAEYETEAEETARKAREAKRDADNDATLKNHRETVKANVKTDLAAIRIPAFDESGNPLSYMLNDAAMAAVLKRLDDGYEQEHTHHAAVIQDRLTTAVLALVPEDKRDGLKQRMDAADSPASLIQEIIDAGAPKSKALKELDLDAFLAMNPAAKLEQARRVKTAVDARQKKIYDLHGIIGEPDTKGGAAGTEMTYAGLLKLPQAEQEKWISRNQAKFNEFMGISNSNGKGK